MKGHKSPTPPAGKLRPQAEKRLKKKSLGGTAELQRSPVRLAHEIEKRKRVEEDGAKQLRFETLLADLSSKFVNLPAGEVDREIMEAERRLCEFLGVDFAALWQLSDETLGYFTVTHVYSVQKGSQESLGRMKVEDFPWFLQEMLAGRIVNLPSLEEMPAEADHDRESCRRLGIKSNLCLPLSVGGGPPFGIFGLNTTRAERDWPDALVKRLQLIAQLFTNALARKRADQALRESEERMALAAEAAGFGVWGWNIARNQIWGSERWRCLFGFASGEDVSFEKVIQRIHPDDREKVGREVRDALANGRNYAGEFRVALPDGTERWIASRGRGYKDASGKLVRMLGAAVDITHRKRTELELAESELRYRALFEAAPEGILLIGTDGHVRTANASQARLYGYESPQQLEGLCAPLCVADKDRERSRQTMRDLLKGEEQPTRCYTAVRRDRSEFIVEVTSAILRGPGRDVQGYLCLTRDITEAKRAEVALRTSEGRLQAGADLAGLGCYEINHAEPSSFADERFGEICGVAPGKQPDLQRMQFWIEHLHPADSERVLEERRKLYEGKVERYDVEYRYLHPAHGQKWIHHLGRVAAGDASGRAIHLYGVVQDITDRKQAEEELQRLRLHLWHADRVAQTGAITASLAHELNQPLTAILSNAQAGLRFMDGGNPDLGEIREILTDIVHDDKRAGAVISGLRNMLRRKETQRERINLASTIEEILALVHSELVGQQIELRLRLEPDSLVLADKGQVQQVILNLVTNAVQAMQDQPASQRRLKLTLTRTNTGEALVAVRDSGPGIPEDQQGKLFEGFWTTKHEGLGIGLPISRSIVETHGGRLSFTNNPDQGATFSFTLPLATNPDSFRTASGSAAGPGATEANEQD